jgi:hypothetical protein
LRASIRTCLAAGLAAVLACSAPDAGVPADDLPSDIPPEVVASLDVRPREAGVLLRLSVSNGTDAVIPVTFMTGQRYDFAVETESGEEVWRWSADMVFTQAVEEARLGPAEVWEYAEVWPAVGRAGRFVAVGRLTSADRPVELRVGFELVPR